MSDRGVLKSQFEQHWDGCYGSYSTPQTFYNEVKENVHRYTLFNINLNVHLCLITSIF